MAGIYIAVTVAGTQTRGAYPLNANGGETLLVIANHYFGTAGGVILAGNSKGRGGQFTMRFYR